MSSKHSTTATAASGATDPNPASAPRSRAAANGGTAMGSTDRVERIRSLAYRFFVERGAADGHALDDWLQAEARVAAQEENGGGAAIKR